MRLTLAPAFLFGFFGIAVSVPIVGLSMAQQSAYANRVLGDGAIGYWRLGETDGSTLVDSAATPHNGTYTGGVTFKQPGAINDGGTAVLFDGTTGTAAVPTWDPLNGLTAVTLEAWVNHNGAAWGATFQVVQYWSTAGMYLAVNNGDLLGSLKISTVQRTATGAAIPTSGWHHIAVTWTSGGNIAVYLDGVVSGTPQGPYTGTLDSAPGLSVAALGGASFFNGSLCEIAVYSVALTAAQVAEHYALRSALDTFQKLTITDTPVGIAATVLRPAGQGQQRACVGRLETAPVRFRFDGVAPTATVGTLLQVGETILMDNQNDAERIRFVRSGGTSGSLAIHCWR